PAAGSWAIAVPAPAVLWRCLTVRRRCSRCAVAVTRPELIPRRLGTLTCFGAIASAAAIIPPTTARTQTKIATRCLRSAGLTLRREETGLPIRVPVGPLGVALGPFGVAAVLLGADVRSRLVRTIGAVVEVPTSRSSSPTAPVRTPGR